MSLTFKKKLTIEELLKQLNIPKEVIENPYLYISTNLETVKESIVELLKRRNRITYHIHSFYSFYEKVIEQSIFKTR